MKLYALTATQLITLCTWGGDYKRANMSFPEIVEEFITANNPPTRELREAHANIYPEEEYGNT